jgi:hypothetical protein
MECRSINNKILLLALSSRLFRLCLVFTSFGFFRFSLVSSFYIYLTRSASAPLRISKAGRQAIANYENCQAALKGVEALQTAIKE